MPPPQDCALLVIDAQERFRALAQPIMPALNSAIDACRAAGAPVVFTLHGHADPCLPEADQERGSVLLKWWGPQNALLVGTKEWQLLRELHRREGDILITNKRTYDAFHGTQLLAALRRRGVRRVAVAGCLTNVCCETTARSAFTHNFEVLFLSDATATERQELQRATLLNIAYGVGRVLTCAELCEELGRLQTPATGGGGSGG